MLVVCLYESCQHIQNQSCSLNVDCFSVVYLNLGMIQEDYHSHRKDNVTFSLATLDHLKFS